MSTAEAGAGRGAAAIVFDKGVVMSFVNTSMRHLLFGFLTFAGVAIADPNIGAQTETVFRAQEALDAKRFDDALRLYTEAAVRGSAVAMFQLGAMNERGEGVRPNLQEAAHWYSRAAEAGSVAGMKRLANMYLDGEGVPRDVAKAEDLYRRAGRSGDSNSLFFLGQMYWMGRNGPRDPQKAVELFGQAADLGHAGALNAIGIAHQLGDGVKKDNAVAYAHFRVAAERGDATATQNSRQLEMSISAEDKARGDEIASRLRQGNPKRPT